MSLYCCWDWFSLHVPQGLLTGVQVEGRGFTQSRSQHGRGGTLLTQPAPPGAQTGHLADNSCSLGLGKNSLVRGKGDVLEGK